MKTIIRVSLLLSIVALWAGSAAPLSAQTVIFNNSSNILGSTYYPGTTQVQVGNEILLAPGTPRFLTTFSFEFYGTNTASPTSFAGSVTAEVRFYENNGSPFNGYPTPGVTPFYDSGPISLASVGATPGQHTLVFTEADWPGGLLIPTSDMTWTVQFGGLGATDSLGLDYYYPATVGGGQTYGDYWAYNGTSWTLETNSVVPLGSFGAYMAATVPEPSTLSLSLLGGLGILALARRLRRKD